MFSFTCGRYEICDETGVGNTSMCPPCETNCRHYKLKDSCTQSSVAYLFDNYATIPFAIFMSFWGEIQKTEIWIMYKGFFIMFGLVCTFTATMFLELWKRKQAVIAWEWDLAGTNIQFPNSFQISF